MEHLLGVNYGGGSYITVGNNGIILSSTDGVKWRANQSSVKYNLQQVAFGSSGFVAVGNAMSLYGVACSSDGKLVVAGKKILQKVLPKSGLSN